MDVLQVFCSAIVLLLMADSLLGDREHFVAKPEQLSMSLGYETVLNCEMNVAPDRFEWKFYPLGKENAYSPSTVINLGSANYTLIPQEMYNPQKMKSELKIRVNSEDAAGDYQCLAYYGAMVVASVPWRITVAHTGSTPPSRYLDEEVLEGNTVAWRCDPPKANPEMLVDYYFNDKSMVMKTEYLPVQNKSIILPNVGVASTGKYTCKAFNEVLNNYNKTIPSSLNLRVVRNSIYRQPYFLVTPRNEYIVNKGESVFLECAAVGNPVPERKWYKQNGNIPYPRAEEVFGGLKISNVTYSDAGIYTCKHTNSLGSISHDIRLIYNEEPSIDCPLSNTSVKLEETLHLNCTVRGVPEPEISWLLNGRSVYTDPAVEAVKNNIHFITIEKRHAGNLQLFASNRVKTVYSSISITVIPLTSNIGTSVTPARTHHRHNGRKSNNGMRKQIKYSKTVMVPPSKPIISRKDDETVVVRWNVTVNRGLAIQFFKVQYRELGPASSGEHHKSGWKTCNEDIPHHARSFEVGGLKPDHYYKFRIAAAYVNNDNGMSNNSDKFLLKRMDFEKKNPLPVPHITSTESFNATAVKIYWDYDPNNVTIAGFYIYYLSASSAGDFSPVTVDGANVRSYTLGHLAPDTYYDVKMQSFTPGNSYSSHYSAIMKAKTKRLATTTTQAPPVTHSSESGGISQLYIFIAAGVIGGALLISGVALLFICRRWKKKKKSGNSDKSAVDEHHIPTEANDYIVSPKSMSRANGCVPSNRITITPNPLADADNKTQNMIEMSCLTSQNNNCSVSSSQPSVSGQLPAEEKVKPKVKNREKRTKNNSDSTSPLCVYKRD